jgi:hypothetical protein
MTCRSLIVRGRGHVNDVVQILQSDWGAQVTGSLLLIIHEMKQVSTAYRTSKNQDVYMDIFGFKYLSPYINISRDDELMTAQLIEHISTLFPP